MNISSDYEKQTRIKTLIAYLMQAFYDVTMPEGKLDIWSEHLSAYSPEDIKRAFSGYIQKNKSFAPNLAGLISEINVSKCELEDIRMEQIAANADKAWNEVIRALHEGGGIYASPDFEDDFIHNAIERLGGWSYLCNSDESQLPWLKKEFCQGYISCAKYPDSVKAIGHVGETGNITRRDALGFWVEVKK